MATYKGFNCHGIKYAQYNSAMTILSVNLSSEILDKLKIYRENFEKAYLEATEEFYKSQAAAYLQENGVQNYMKYVRIDERYFCC